MYSDVPFIFCSLHQPRSQAKQIISDQIEKLVSSWALLSQAAQCVDANSHRTEFNPHAHVGIVFWFVASEQSVTKVEDSCAKSSACKYNLITILGSGMAQLVSGREKQTCRYANRIMPVGLQEPGIAFPGELMKGETYSSAKLTARCLDMYGWT